jgi:hypothetical protein
LRIADCGLEKASTPPSKRPNAQHSTSNVQ